MDLPSDLSGLRNNSASSDSAIDIGEGLDGDIIDPIVVCGFSMRFPQDAISPRGLWELMMEKKCAMTEFSHDRINLEGFYRTKNRANTIPAKGGHFLKEDLSVFDADFFGIAPTEAASLDPMQRWLLEEAYQALENAGIPIEDVAGSRTAVYAGSFGFDYMLQLCRDPENPPPYAALGFGISMLANRLSWFFDLRGPSIGLDSACSSTAMGIDLACKSLRDNSCDMAMVAGCNIATSPESYLFMSNIGFLSPDSRCHSFDHRANGYARGEGIGVVLLKRLSHALRDGNTIRAVIRSTGSNEDGRTPGITQPSRIAQERLILETYEKAGLSMAHTRFFEAHGTGTAIGDPREAQAIGSVFRKYRSTHDPLYVGALKSNIGHLEGASGLAALIKTIMILEKGIIPPNANFEKLNPKIDDRFLKLKFSTDACPWPSTGLRRASINSFGYGGANSHMVLDDAYNYMKLRSITGKHATSPSPSVVLTNGHSIEGRKEENPPRLIALSSADQAGNARISRGLQNWYELGGSPASRKRGTLISDLAHTLVSHRSQLQWRSFAIIKSKEELSTLSSIISSPVRASSHPPRLAFVFTGQGAQWHAMGRELIAYSEFNAELHEAEKYLKSIGCTWSLTEELMRTKQCSKIEKPEYSQTCCTVLQIALVNLMRRFNVLPSAVVGHSSGEIAAAYAGGYITRESAWKLAYYRGICSAELVEQTSFKAAGAMISVALSEEDALHIVAAANRNAQTFGLSVACINSPVNVTIAGEERLIDQLQRDLDEQKVFARKLRVPVAYHSHQMEFIATKYATMIGGPLESSDDKVMVPMISSVIGEQAAANQLVEPSYWVNNMTSTVRFHQAVTLMCKHTGTSIVKKIDRSHVRASLVDHFLEIGPHEALQGPLREIMRATPRATPVGYNSVLKRGHSALYTTLDVLGSLHCMGYPVDLATVNTRSNIADSEAELSLLVDLPAYPFDHSQRYWEESRLSRNYRLRDHAPSQLLGVRSRDWNASDARWLNVIRTGEMRWAEQHVINGKVLYPGSGMLVMAIEAAKQLLTQPCDIDGYTLRNVNFTSPIDLGFKSGSIEVETHLRELDSAVMTERMFDFTVRSWFSDLWILNCRGTISVTLKDTNEGWLKDKITQQRNKMAAALTFAKSQCVRPVDSHAMYRVLRENGHEYGPAYQAAQHQYCNDEPKQGTAEILLCDLTEDEHVIHPVTLDAIMHFALTAKTSGGSEPMATSIPSRISCLWLSNDGLSSSTQSSVTTCTSVEAITNRGFACSGGVLNSLNELRLWYEDFELVNVTSVATPTSLFPNPKQFCMSIECKVAIEKLTPAEICAFVLKTEPVTQNLEKFHHDVRVLVEKTLECLVETIDPTTLVHWKRHYWDWANYHLSQGYSVPEQHSNDAQRTYETLLDDVRGASRMGRLYAEVASNLVAIFNDDINPLETLLNSGVMKGAYADWAEYECAKQAARYIDLLAHQSPGMIVLEVGGGTAATTRRMISILRSGSEGSARSLRCNRYDFTDISAAFLEKSREEFSAFHEQMKFGTLDIEQSLVIQGYEEHSYDLVLADNVLHVTSNLARTLRNVRKALKPGGKLVMHELLRPTGWTAGFIFGIFPGWWLGIDDGRTLSPNLAPDQWDTLLKENGFSGVDITFRDFNDDVSHQVGWLVTTAVEDQSGLPVSIGSTEAQPILIIDEASAPQRALAKELKEPLCQLFGAKPCVIDLTAVNSSQIVEPGAFVVFLRDYGSSFLGTLDEDKWKCLSSLISTTRKLLWVSAGGGRHAAPDHGLLDGLARTLRVENYDLHLVTVALDFNGVQTSKIMHIMQVAREMLRTTTLQSYEQEYIEIDGLLHVRRLVEAADLKASMDANLKPYTISSVPLDGTTRFHVSSESLTGPDDTPFYTLDTDDMIKRQHCTSSDIVEILVRAATVQYQEHNTALKEGSAQLHGSYCSGLVLNAGPKSSLQSGDRVLAVQPGSMRSHVYAPSQLVVKIPGDTSFADACRLIPPMVTAYHAVVEIGGIKPGQSILIHDADSFVGQTVLRILASSGVTDVWATVQSSGKAVAWTEELRLLPAERVLPVEWFDGQSPLVSQLKRKFNVVLNQMDDAKSLLLEFVRPGGRSITVGTLATVAKETQWLRSVPPDVCISTIGANTATPEALAFAVSTLPTVPRHSTYNSTVIPAPKVSDMLKKVQGPNDIATKIVTFDENNVVDVRNYYRKVAIVNARATYIVAGGFGGVGRAVTRWLVSRGACYIILLSRSGPRTAEAQALLSELTETGVNVEAPCCDISDRALLKTLLERYRNELPPIKGCIQSTMVMTERVFQNMQFDDWKSTVDPKVRGSWNLHAELPQGMDFFILFSSINGILGSGSLAAYNAGNTYEDALASYRVSQGERAMAIDLGAVPDAGYFVDHSNQLKAVQRVEMHTLTYVKEICALLDLFCSSEHYVSSELNSSQTIVGLRPPAHWKHLEEIPLAMSQPLWAHMHHVAPIDGTGETTGEKIKREENMDTAAKLAGAGSIVEATEIVRKALTRRVSELLGTPEDRLGEQKPMHSFGIDSLSAIDIRNWVGEVFNVDMPVFDILGGATFSSASRSIVYKAQLA